MFKRRPKTKATWVTWAAIQKSENDITWFKFSHIHCGVCVCVCGGGGGGDGGSGGMNRNRYFNLIGREILLNVA